MSFSQSIGDSQVTGDFSRLNKLAKELGKKFYVDVGILGGDTTEEGITLAGIGAVHEFGSPEQKIPERSFIRMPIEKMSGEIEKSVEPHIQKKLASGDIKGIFKLMGLSAEEQIQKAFESGGFGLWPDIKDETKKRKGSSAILIDEGDLRKAVTSRVGGG